MNFNALYRSIVYRKLELTVENYFYCIPISKFLYALRVLLKIRDRYLAISCIAEVENKEKVDVCFRVRDFLFMLEPQSI